MEKKTTLYITGAMSDPLVGGLWSSAAALEKAEALALYSGRARRHAG
jgi:hypothetical protein